MKKAVLFLLAAIAAVLSAEESRIEVSAPFVSRLKATSGDTSIMLSWRDSPDVKGVRLVYRAAEQIDEANLARATLVARLEADVNSYEDVPPDQQPYYYAVLLEDARGAVYKLLIPYRNKTSSGARISSPPAEQALAARIFSLTATALEDSIRLSFQPSKSDRVMLLFRSSSPMRSAVDLLASTSPVTLDAGSRGFTDYPMAGIDYYYAIVDAGLFKIGSIELVAGQNSTTDPVQVPPSPSQVSLEPLASLPAAPGAGEASAPAGSQDSAQTGPQASTAGSSARAAPLPFLSISAGVGTGIQLPPTPFALPKPVGTLNPATQKAIASVLADCPPLAALRLEPQALPADQGVSGESEAYGLQVIMDALQLDNDLNAAQAKLFAFLSIRRSEEATARAHFYLGQVYYLQKSFERSFLELLFARDRYYAAVQPWLDACLLELQRG